MDLVLETHDLCKYFGRHMVLDHLNLQVPRGSLFALLGENGTGKTTTLRILAGLLPPDSGTATILGKNSFTQVNDLREKVGYVPERPKFYDWMSIREIGWFTSGFHGASYFQYYLSWLEKLMGPSGTMPNSSAGISLLVITTPSSIVQIVRPSEANPTPLGSVP